MSARGFWQDHSTCVFDVQVSDTDAPSCGNADPLTTLQRLVGAKKAKHGPACHERRKEFTPLIFSVDGMLETEARAALKRFVGSSSHG